MGQVNWHEVLLKILSSFRCSTSFWREPLSMKIKIWSFPAGGDLQKTLKGDIYPDYFLYSFRLVQRQGLFVVGRGSKETATSTPASRIDTAKWLLMWYNAKSTRKSFQISLLLWSTVHVCHMEESLLPKMQVRFEECSPREIILQQCKLTLGCNWPLMQTSFH